MKHLPWLLCVLLVVSTVSAQETSVPSAAQNAAPAPESLTPLVIEVRAQRVSRSALSDALLKELRQGGKPGEVEQPKGALELRDSASNTVRLTYRDALGRVTTRDLYIAPDDPEALEKITIAAANLVRDQTGVISALEAQARAEEEAALKALENAPKPEAKAAPAPQPEKPVYDPCHPPLAIPFGIDLAPMLGTSSTPLGRQSARRVSIGLAGTYSAGVHGLQLSIGANIDRRGMCGVEFAAGLNMNLGDGRGLQMAVLNATLGALRGAQLGITNFARKGVYGAQLGVANVAFGPVKAGLGVLNVANGDTKIQLGVANFSGGNAQGQLGVTNVAWGNASAQLGVVNIAKERVRSQFGVFNYSGSARAPLGLISIVRDGHTSLDAWVNENGAMYGMLSHGGSRIYNMYGVGARFQKDYAKNHTRLALAYGIGARMYNDPRFALDLQVLYELYPRLQPWRSHSQTERLRLAADIKLTDRMSLVPAVGYAIMISEWASEPVQAPFAESTFRHQRVDARGRRHVGVYGFPSFGLGFRILLSDPKKPRD